MEATKKCIVSFPNISTQGLFFQPDLMSNIVARRYLTVHLPVSFFDSSLETKWQKSQICFMEKYVKLVLLLKSATTHKRLVPNLGAVPQFDIFLM